MPDEQWKDVTNGVSNPQDFTFGVSGPDGANRVHVCNGQVFVGSPEPFQYSIRFAVGPVLTADQFIQATISAGVTGLWAPGLSPIYRVGAGSPIIDFRFELSELDADWDDETGRVVARLQLPSIDPSGIPPLRPTSFSYHILILAKQ